MIDSIPAAYQSFANATGDAYSEWAWAFTLLRPVPGDLGLIPLVAKIGLESIEQGRSVAALLPNLQAYAKAQSQQTWAALLTAAQQAPWISIVKTLATAGKDWEAGLKGRIISDQLKPFTQAFSSALHLASMAVEALPPLLDTAQHGSLTLLIVAQNNDELRATGGFITALLRIRVDQQGALAMEFLNSYAVDNPSRLAQHPAAPAALQLFMDLPLWVFRDANWSPDFPASARTAARIYKLDQDDEPDVIIAVNLNVIRALTDVLGPLQVEGTTLPLDGDSVLTHIRHAWNIKPETFTDAGAKDFLKPFLTALLQAAQNTELSRRANALATIQTLLDQRDVMLFSTLPDVQNTFSRYGWDGAQITPKPTTDYLMWVESNVGYNKVGPNISRQAAYHISLSDPSRPFARATIRFYNNNPLVSCADNAGVGSGTYEQRMVVCYWNLLRLYVPVGSTLLSQNLASIAPENMVTRVGTIGGASLYPDGMTRNAIEGLLLVPAGEMREAVFVYSLPGSIVEHNSDGTFTYRLTVQKQAGVPVYPLELTIDLPQNAQIISASVPPLEGQSRHFNLDVLASGYAFSITYRLDAK